MLSGRVKGDLLTVSLALAAQMLMLADIAQTEEQAMIKLQDALESGRALDTFATFIKAQGGDSRVTKDTSLLPRANIKQTLHARQDGVLSAVNCRGLGEAAGLLGAGRVRKDDIVDPAVGFIVKKRIGEPVKKGEALIDIYANDEHRLGLAIQQLEKCIVVAQSAEKPVLLLGTVC